MKIKVPFTRFDKSIVWEDYEHTDWHCPSCGKKTVWQECSEGDYYAGPEIVCSSCGGTMQWPSRGEKTKRLDVLSAAIAEAELKAETKGGAK